MAPQSYSGLQTERPAFRRFFSNLGPGLITGAADDDPSGISTYSVAGAAFGYLPLWTALFSFPLMAAVQLMCARLGLVTGLGLAGVIRRRYSPWALWSACALLIVASVINIAADLGGMAEATMSATHPGGIMGAMSPHVSIDRDAVSAFCRRHHIKRLALFGSVLRDDFRPDSDVDVLVEFQPGHVPGLDFVAIEREFSGLLQGRRVDMVTPKFLNPRIRDQVLTSAEPLYVAA